MHGGESSVASPVAGAVIRAYFQEKQQTRTPAPLLQTQASLAPVAPQRQNDFAAKNSTGNR
jgi:hypothetical protein